MAFPLHYNMGVLPHKIALSYIVFVLTVYVLHDHPLYLVCPNVLSPVGELLSGDGCGSPNHI